MKKFLVSLLALFIVVSIYLVKNSSPDSTSYERFNIVSPGIIRTPDERFDNLEDYNFKPNYIEINGLRIHIWMKVLRMVRLYIYFMVSPHGAIYSES